MAHDVLSQLWARKAENDRHFAARLESRRIRKWESNAARVRYLDKRRDSQSAFRHARTMVALAAANRLRAIYQNLSCLQAISGCPGPAVAVLGRALRERNAALLDEIFYLLAAIQDLAAIKTVANSLRSPQPEVRANAAEALESMTAPQTAALVGLLFEPDPPSGQLLSLARQTWDISIPTPAAAMRLLLNDTNDAWQRTLAAAEVVQRRFVISQNWVRRASQWRLAGVRIVVEVR